jgi:hypothetical protein
MKRENIPLMSVITLHNLDLMSVAAAALLSLLYFTHITSASHKMGRESERIESKLFFLFLISGCARHKLLNCNIPAHFRAIHARFFSRGSRMYRVKMSIYRRERENMR